MSVPEACILRPIAFAAAAPVLRVVVAGVEQDAVLSGITDDDLRGWFMAEDDLVGELEAALNDMPGAGPGLVEFFLELDDDNVLQVAADDDVELLWTHPNTTLDPALFGFAAADVGPGQLFTAPNQTRGIWIPGAPGEPRGVLEDTLDGPQTGMVLTRTLDGRVRGYDLSPAPGVRTVSWYRIPVSRVLPELAVSTQPYCTFTEAWLNGVGSGEPFRLYDDRTNRSSFGLYQCTSGGRPWKLEEINGTRRYEIGPLDLVRVD